MTTNDEELEVLRTSVRRIAARYDRRYWMEKARAGEHVEELWREIARAGWLGVTIPEAYGGSEGMSLLIVADRSGLTGDDPELHRRARSRSPPFPLAGSRWLTDGLESMVGD